MRQMSKTKTVGEVPNAFTDYYKMLFEPKKIYQRDLNDALNLLSRKKLLQKSRDAIETPFTVPGIQSVMEKLALGKSAGPNRIPNAVYRYLSKHFAPKFKAMIEEAVRRERLPKSMLEGEISVLYKKNDRDDVRNYRPITLLNSDYKIYTKLLAQSMPGGSMGHGFNYQLVMERCKQLSETDTNDSSTRKFRKISQKNVNVVDSSVKGLSSLF